MKLTEKMKNSLPALYFGLPRLRQYPMAVIVSGKAKWDKRHAALAKARAKQQYSRGFLTTSQYNRIITKADKVLAMKQSRSMKANTKKHKNTAIQMTPDFDDPQWTKYKTKVAKKRKSLKKKNTRKRKNQGFQPGSSTGGGYMLAMRGLREGDYAEKVPAHQLNREYIPVGYSSETDSDVMDTALVAGKPLKKKKRNPSRGWFKFTIFAKSGKKLATRIGRGTKTEANIVGKRFLGTKFKGRIIHRIVIDGPLKNKPEV